MQEIDVVTLHYVTTWLCCLCYLKYLLDVPLPRCKITLFSYKIISSARPLTSWQTIITCEFYMSKLRIIQNWNVKTVQNGEISCTPWDDKNPRKVNCFASCSEKCLIVRATVILEPNQCTERIHFPALTTEEHYYFEGLAEQLRKWVPLYRKGWTSLSCHSFKGIKLDQSISSMKITLEVSVVIVLQKVLTLQ